MTAVNINALARTVERHPLAVALALSVVIHLGVYGGWHVGKQFGWWKHQPAWLVNWTRKLAKPPAAKAKENQASQEMVIPLTFVEVDPETAVAEPPKDAKYYSSKNSRAQNPDPKEQAIPKVDGRQDQVVRLMDNEKPKAFPLQPSAPKEQVAQEPKPKSEAPGDLALVKPRPPSDGQEATTGDSLSQSRPRTVTEAKLRKGLLTGEKIKQEGGVSKVGRVSFDAKATPFGDYDAAFISAVEQCWHNLLDEHLGTRRPGKVTVDFKLSYDGRIVDMKVQENEVGEILGMLCQSAILNPAPYPRWPAQMRQSIPGNFREIRFTFYYN